MVDASALVHLPPDGSDEFGSAAFFSVNGARYGALLTIAEAGYSLFVLDLDEWRCFGTRCSGCAN